LLAGVFREVHSQFAVHGQREGLLLRNAMLRVDSEHVFEGQVAVLPDRLRPLREVRVPLVLIGAESFLFIEAQVFVE